jgi:hypothetical protein
MVEGTLRFQVEAGALFRNGVRREIEQYAWDANLELTLREDKGFIDSVFYVTMVGPEQKIRQALKDVNAWGAQL